MTGQHQPSADNIKSTQVAWQEQPKQEKFMKVKFWEIMSIHSGLDFLHLNQSGTLFYEYILEGKILHEVTRQQALTTNPFSHPRVWVYSSNLTQAEGYMQKVSSNFVELIKTYNSHSAEEDLKRTILSLSMCSNSHHHHSPGDEK